MPWNFTNQRTISIQQSQGAMTYDGEESVGQRRIRIIGSGDFTSPSLGSNNHIEHLVEASQGMDV